MDGVENRFLVFLQVAAVAERGTLHQSVERAEVAEHAAGLSADEFHGIRILLLRHHRGSAGEGVVQGEVTEFAGAPVHEIFGVAAHRVRDNGEVGFEFEHHVAMAHGVDAVRANTVKSEFLCYEGAVVREGGTGHGAATERKFAVEFQEVVEALHVAAHGEEHAHQVMAEVNRLCLLQVRVTRHHLAEVLFREVEHRFHQRNFEGADFGGAVTHVELEVRADLVVTAAARVNLLAKRADAFGEHAFHGHVDVFVRFLPQVLAGLVVLENAGEAIANLLVVGLAEHARFHQALAVADAAFDVFFDEFGVELQAEAQVHHALRHAASKTAGPHVGLGALLGFVFRFLCAGLCHFQVLLFFRSAKIEKFISAIVYRATFRLPR